MSAPSSDSAGIRQIIRGLKAAGYTLEYVNDGDEDGPTVTKTEKAAIDTIMAVDYATLCVSDSEGKIHGVYFVLGNSPEEVACDWHVSLSHVIDPITDYWMEN